jgi:MFS family permease
MGTPNHQRFRFGRLWAAAVASNLGDGLVLAAFPLLAATITVDPIAISLITLASGLPWLVLAPLSGAIVDRFDRRMLMVTFDAFRTVTLGLFAVALWSGTTPLWVIYLVVFVIAAGETVVDTSAQSILPAIVPKERLDLANGRLFSTMTVAHRFVGPPLGGLLFGVAAVIPVIADSASFAIAALLMYGLRGPFRPDPESQAKTPGIAKSIGEGLSWLWQNKPIRTFAIGAALLNIGIMAGEAILVLFAGQDLGITGVGFGALFAATAAGYAGGSAFAPRLTQHASRLKILATSVTAVSTSLIAIGWARHWIVATIGLFAVGVASGLWDVIAVSYRQAAVPDRLLGRIMAAYRVVAHGSIPVGAILGGLAARLGGNRLSFIAGGLVALVALIYVTRKLRGVELNPALIDSTDA